MQRFNGSSRLDELSWRQMEKSARAIHVKRVYEPASLKDGERFLVERLWPRGVAKKSLRLSDWLKEVGPSTSLRRWFSHDAEKWTAFRRRYFLELDHNPDAWSPILKAARKGPVTLIFSSRDLLHNNAVALKEYLEEDGIEPANHIRVAADHQAIAPLAAEDSAARSAVDMVNTLFRERRAPTELSLLTPSVGPKRRDCVGFAAVQAQGGLFRAPLGRARRGSCLSSSRSSTSR